jgi:hypothetical protein
MMFLLSCLTSPTTQAQTKENVWEQATPICAILADTAKYDGEEILVRGIYRAQIHGSILMGHSCSQIDVNLREIHGYKVNKQTSAVLRSLTKKDRFHPVDVVFRGTFRVAHQLECFGEICAMYEIEITEIVSARPEQPVSGSGAPPMKVLPRPDGAGLSHEATGHAQGTSVP